jgi:hypothetical protein
MANNNIGPNNNTKVSFLDRNWEVQVGSPDQNLGALLISVPDK